MLLLIGELLGFLGEVLALGAANAATDTDDRRRRSRREEVSGTLLRVAHALEGTFRKPWFRKPRVLGHHEGRDVELIWLGRGRVEVRCRASGDLHLLLSRGLLGRLFGGGLRFSPSSEGWQAHAQELTRRFDLERLEVRHGQLVARGLVGLDVARLRALAVALVELAWAPAVPVRVRAREGAPTAAAPPLAAAPRSPAGLRCPFCHDALSDAAPVVHCAACDAPHHPSCFEEGAGCSIAGCQERKARGRRGRA